jgi:acyl-CoA synthetase (AMP-forming)/AMP-acid ligase II
MNPAIEGNEANVVSYLERASRRCGTRTSLVDGARSVSFRELWERVDRTSAGLRAAGLCRGERAVLMVPMSIELYVVMLAVLELGAVGVFVDPWIGRRQIAAFSAFAEPAAWIGIARSHLLRLFDPALRRIPLTVTSGRRLGPLPARITLAELERHAGDGAIHAALPDDPALVTFTTGSSGLPKGANRTHGFLAAQHAALAAEFPCRDDDVDMPMFPVFALNNLATGIPSVIPSLDFARVAELDAAAVLQQMRAHGVTTCTASPPFFDRIVAHVTAGRASAPRLRRILTGGAPVSDRQLESWRRALPGVEILVVYGSTEAEPVAHITAEERLALAPPGGGGQAGFCAGRPCSRVRARIVRITAGPIRLGARGWEEWELGAGAVGELVVTGAHVGRDYYRNPQAVEENKIRDAEGGVWHRMGDTGRLDREGRFWLVGRVHSTIRRAGALVHPQLVEQAALGDDAEIRRVAAVGLRDASLGERVLVLVESAGGASVGERVAARLRQAALPCDELRVSSTALPVDPRHNSKIDYAALRRSLD